VWKRGRVQDETPLIDVNEYNVDYDVNATFVKPSSFWIKNSQYELKTCDFFLYQEIDGTKT
jgi:hypothetical protein